MRPPTPWRISSTHQPERRLNVITLHRLGHTDEPFQLNPDLIVTIESTPDTVVTLATTAKVVVAESPEEVADFVRAWRVEVLSEAMRNRRPERDPSPVRPVHAN
jgi:flagellar protein FlbD